MTRFPFFVLLAGLVLPSGCALAQGSLVRGPYWQVVTPTSAIVRWRTDQPTTGRVWFGPDAGQLTGSLRETQPTQEHTLTLTGLQPNTRYAYAIGYDETRLASGPDYYLKTAPTTGDTKPVRLWVLGDFGNGTDNQKRVYQAFQNVTASRPADLWLWLGDNAYSYGKEDEYQQYVFNVYGSTFRNTPIVPAPGNHDYADNRTNFDVAYLNLFSFPQNGEAGGVPSGVKNYYSVNYGNIHIISLDSQTEQPDNRKRLYDTTSTQVQWLKRDLAANRALGDKQPWTIVTFHHPPYSKGSHDSDTEEQMRLLRENLTPIFERYGVDLVLNGHSHDYERYYRLHNQTGLANTFDPARHVAENTTARYDGSPNSCPLLTKGVGTVYIVNGSGGAQGGVSPGYPHPGMVAGYRGDVNGGSLVLDITDNRLDGQFIYYDGSVPDRFTIVKNVNKNTSLRAEFADTLQLTASWPAPLTAPDAYLWTSGQATRSIRYVADKAGTFPLVVDDRKQCLADQFTITVSPPPRLITTLPGESTPGSTTVCAGSSLAVLATPENTTKAAGWQYDVLLSDASGNFTAGQVVGSGSLGALRATLPASLPAGSGYRLRVRPRAIPYATLTDSPTFTVRTTPTAVLSGSAVVLAGQQVLLTLTFTGTGPWRGALSDGTAFTAVTNPTIVPINPVRSATYTVQFVENECGKGTVSGQAQITIVAPPAIVTATDDPLTNRLRIFPNPTHDRVTVNLAPGPKAEVMLRLTDVQGRVIYQKQAGSVTTISESVALPHLGTYLLQVQVGNNQQTQQVIRQ